MQPAEAVMPYTGPRPSPAGRWAPALIVTMVAAALLNAVLFVLNLIERHNLQRAKAGRPVSHAFFEDTLSTINAAARLTLVAAVAIVVVGIVWSVKRRSPRRRREGGESAVEPSVVVVSRRLYTVFWVMLAFAVLVSEIAKSTRHVGMTVDDFISYRTYLAAGDLFRVAMWGSYIGLVIKATKLQERRELASLALPPVQATG